LKTDATFFASTASGLPPDASGLRTDATFFASRASVLPPAASGSRTGVTFFASRASGLTPDASGLRTGVTFFASRASGLPADASGLRMDATFFASTASGLKPDASGSGRGQRYALAPAAVSTLIALVQSAVVPVQSSVAPVQRRLFPFPGRCGMCVCRPRGNRRGTRAEQRPLGPLASPGHQVAMLTRWRARRRIAEVEDNEELIDHADQSVSELQRTVRGSVQVL